MIETKTLLNWKFPCQASQLALPGESCKRVRIAYFVRRPDLFIKLLIDFFK